MEATFSNVLFILLLLAAFNYLSLVFYERLRPQLIAPGMAPQREGFTDVQQTETYLNNEALYDEFYASVYDQLTQNVRMTQQKIVSIVAEWKKAGTKLEFVDVLDAGCGTGIASGARVVGFTTDTVYVNKANTGSVSGVATFFKNVSEDVTIGMGVTHSNLPGEINAIPANTKVIGIDEKSRLVYLNNALVNNIQSATGDTVTFASSKVSTGSTAHGLVPGDVIYIAAGTGNTSTTSSTYTIFETPNSTTFTTTPALNGAGAATLYSSIFFAERFTNGPYNIQNNGDQIKVTLNISLD
jgi:hypothetical protein